jgi:phosphoribosyl 1,2-cyclic phosphodiesterase
MLPQSRTQATDRLASIQHASAKDQKIVEFLNGTDVLIIDAQYDDAEYQKRVGWGHGCVDDVVAMALFAHVKQLFLFHHDPDHDDGQMLKMLAWARELVSLAGETMIVDAACEGFEHVLQPEGGTDTSLPKP